MSVRLRKWKDKDGREHQGYVVDVKFRHANCEVERVRRPSPVNTRRGAEQYERQVREELLAGTFGKEQPKREMPTLHEFASVFLEDSELNGNKYSTMVSKRQLLRDHIEPFFGSMRLDQIELDEIQKFKAKKLKEKLEPKTINNGLTVLRKLLIVAVERKRITHVPLMKWFKVKKPDFDFLNFEEADRLIAAAEPEWKPMITLAIRTGLRLGELLTLRWDDADLHVGRLMVKKTVWRGVEGLPKGNRIRESPLSEDAISALKKQIRHLHSPYIFHNSEGHRLTEGQVKWPLYRTCKRARLRRIGWHVLRHTFASHLAMRGVPLKTIQELMGHATIEMTMRYAHLTPDIKRDAVKLLDGPSEMHGRGTLGAHGKEVRATS